MKHRKPNLKFDMYELEYLVLAAALGALIMLWLWRF